MIWALWVRRWRGSPRGLLGIALAVGIGLHAKLTFVIVAGAVALSAVLLRHDRPPMGPPSGSSMPRALGALLLPLAPLVLANLHQTQIPPPHIRSHDQPGLQLERVLGALQGQATPARESLTNIVAWIGDPLGFLGRTYGVDALSSPPWLLIGLGWSVTLLGIAMVWRQRHPTPREALLRLCSIILVTGISGLLFVARDLHHLAVMSVVVAMVVGLAADQIAGRWAPPRSSRRTLAALILVSPWLVSGVMQLQRTDAVVAQIDVPTFTRDGQAALAELLVRADSEQVWVADYETMGALELALEGSLVEVVHGWGAASLRTRWSGRRSGLTSWFSQTLRCNQPPLTRRSKHKARVLGASNECIKL